MKTIQIPLITRVSANKGNPGDGFIRWGLQYLIESHTGSLVNWILISKFNKDLDFKKNKNILDKIKKVIYAGTPQYNNYDDWRMWYDYEMYQYLKEKGIKCISIAGGSGVPQCHFSPRDFSSYCLGSEFTREVLTLRKETTQSCSVRDEYAHKLLNDLNFTNKLLPCTATWSGHYYKIKSEKEKIIGLTPPSLSVLHTSQTGSGDKNDSRVSVLNTFKSLIKNIKRKYPEHKILVISHHKKEYDLFEKYLDVEDLFYSNNAKTLLELYSKCEIVISGRLHGCLPAYGFPGTKVVSLEIDTRGSAVKLFPKIKRVLFRDIQRNETKIKELVESLEKVEPSEEEDLLKWEKEYSKFFKDLNWF